MRRRDAVHACTALLLRNRNTSNTAERAPPRRHPSRSSNLLEPDNPGAYAPQEFAGADCRSPGRRTRWGASPTSVVRGQRETARRRQGEAQCPRRDECRRTRTRFKARIDGTTRATKLRCGHRRLAANARGREDPRNGRCLHSVARCSVQMALRTTPVHHHDRTRVQTRGPTERLGDPPAEERR